MAQDSTETIRIKVENIGAIKKFIPKFQYNQNQHRSIIDEQNTSTSSKVIRSKQKKKTIQQNQRIIGLIFVNTLRNLKKSEHEKNMQYAKSNGLKLYGTAILVGALNLLFPHPKLLSFLSFSNFLLKFSLRPG